MKNDRKMQKILQKICVYQKKVVPLHAFLRVKRLKACNNNYY